MKLLKALSAASIASGLIPASPSYAYDWVFVARGKQPDEIYHIDVESIKRDGQNVTFWDLSSSIENINANKIKSQMTINCKTNEFKILYSVEYFKDGDNGNAFGSGTWYPIAPQTINEVKKKFVCDGYRPKDPLADSKPISTETH